MTLLLDSDTVIDWLADALTENLATKISANRRSISVITLMEVLEGIPEADLVAMQRLRILAKGTTIRPVTVKTAYAAATIRRNLRAKKAQVDHRSLDILIAATAIEHDLTLVTRNTRHFHDIDGLRILTNDPS